MAIAALRERIEAIEARQVYAEDRLGIHECLWRYCRGLDRHDEELESSAFWPDAQVNYGHAFSGSLADFIAWGNQGHDSFFDMHQHHLTNVTVDIDGDRAHVESYLINLMRRKDEKLDIGGARYIDLFEKRDGEWRILIREYLPDVRTEGPATVTGLGLPPSGPGRWDREDLSYARPLQRRPANDPAATAWRK
ncbi:nuclear transport factor 2 family protein [Parasphingopyxis marina]|uniref:Nuclear transport factor 2 family protein n=1 Tax=Parasphingopyxis marina TaxID=2761622 RepID=A0A842HX32_9SPHN|nr:nuclear transport factor 2 family protein [Parasphingopyxis marina]MBC2777023.1 nuclear transport factor 2 family protein [Parasphingopyxis marina]